MSAQSEYSRMSAIASGGFDEDRFFKRHHHSCQPHGRVFFTIRVEPLVAVSEVIHRMEEPLLVIDAADKPGIFQAVRTADGFPLLFAA